MPLPLLRPTEPAAFTVERAASANPLLLCCDHASNRVPASLGTLGLDPALLASHIAWDIGIRGVAVRLAELIDATLVLQNYSRLVIDCNRPLAAPDSIAVRSEAIEIAANAELGDAERLARRAGIFAPYHDAIRAALDAGRTQLLSLHSFTPVYHGVARPWQTGVLYQRDDRMGQRLLALLSRDQRLHVGDNEPYAMDDASDYTLVEHGERRGIAHAGIEIRQDLIADEPGQREWAQRLADLLPDILIR